MNFCLCVSATVIALPKNHRGQGCFVLIVLTGQKSGSSARRMPLDLNIAYLGQPAGFSSWSGWLPFYDEAKVNKCSLVLKRLQGNCPSYMYDLLKCNADLHTRSGRYSALNFVCPRYDRKSEEGRTFSVSATRLWNSLPINLKKGICVTSFRKAIYSHFLTRYNDVDHFSLSET